MNDLVGAGRYAPSPSGRLHVGNLRTALVAWLCARSTGRAFLVRVEDLDRGRDAGAASEQLAELAAIGIDWDGEVVLQTERGAAHAAAIRRLASAGLVYECTCSRADILAAPTAPHAPPGAYPGTCRDRTAEERSRARTAIAPRLPALRLKVPEGTVAPTITDRILGQVPGVVDDFVLRRGDGTIAYNLAVVVDDADMGVDQVVRGDDLASSTSRQILLQRLLGLPEPEYAHVPLVLGANGARLAKRDGAVTLEDLAADGVDAVDVRRWMAESLGLAAPGQSIEMASLLERFDVGGLTAEPVYWADMSPVAGTPPTSS
ncbi:MULTISPECIES: tRNA glutamyl-Q(34) synthetase GluQRS [unclassified Leucobacter]|uniref:tRNA glutamyl-Q(34) synthetase GluQRS n=1 Tax=unclassified Leucobacter TaxID=2621730 RepID=UPI00165E4EC8|nr:MULTISPECIES: tRNA glutamyl-Q(34) synthetase GluQRS [unclassified Leucobacter]MBC9935444.1 tRNA glutamyl-Q(34) synthetase GluQRS [Leucobacter sp. cx-87]